jgi:hypothetical protein
MMVQMFNFFKNIPSWLNHTILSIVFFIVIMIFMILGKYIDGAGMIGFYIFLCFWIGIATSVIGYGIVYIIKAIKKYLF